MSNAGQPQGSRSSSPQSSPPSNSHNGNPQLLDTGTAIVTELRARLDRLVADIIAKNPPRQSPYDEYTWDKTTLLMMDRPCPFTIAFDIHEAWHSGSSPPRDETDKCRCTDLRIVQWNPTATEIFEGWGEQWRWETIEWILDMLDRAAASQLKIGNVLQHSRTEVLFGLADVVLDVVGYVSLACRHLLILKSHSWHDTTTYPEERFILDLEQLGADALAAIDQALQDGFKKHRHDLLDKDNSGSPEEEKADLLG
jgi:hypothetical protein